MMEIWKTLLSVVVGGATTFLASFLLEGRKLNNEKFRFNREKIIAVGEDFYRFSAYALIRFETLLHNYETLGDFGTQAARDLLQQTDQNVQNLLAKIGENNITITMADLFYDVSGAEKATAIIQSMKTGQAKIEEIIATGGNYNDLEETLEEVKQVLREYIALIKSDRQKIADKLKELLALKA